MFTLEQQEGRLFSPLAYTKTFAMGASALLAITVIPVLMFYLVRGRIRREEDNPVSRFFIAGYRPIIRLVLRFPLATLGIALALVILTAWPLSRLGSEFMPPLNEGDLLYMPTTPPGISITKARELLQQTDRIIAKHPQVRHVLGKIGRAETATDPAPLTMIETTIILTPQEEWPEGKQIEDIIRELDAMVQLPGVTNAWTMPIKTRIDMLATGIKTPVGIKLLGDDLETLSKVGVEIEGALDGAPRNGLRLLGAGGRRQLPEHPHPARRRGPLRAERGRRPGGGAVGHRRHERQRDRRRSGALSDQRALPPRAAQRSHHAARRRGAHADGPHRAARPGCGHRHQQGPAGDQERERPANRLDLRGSHHERHRRLRAARTPSRGAAGEASGGRLDRLVGPVRVHGAGQPAPRRWWSRSRWR